MAITRKLLKGMGLTEEQQDTIIEAHTDTVNGLKADVDRYKADAEKLPGVQKELNDLKGKGDDGYKEKYESEHKAFEDYKTSVAAEKTTAAKEKALETALKKSRHCRQTLAVCCPTLQRRWSAGQAGIGRKRRYQGF